MPVYFNKTISVLALCFSDRLNGFFAVEQLYTEQHPSCCNGDFFWVVHFAWWEFDPSTGIYITFTVYSAAISFEHAS